MELARRALASLASRVRGFSATGRNSTSPPAEGEPRGFLAKVEIPRGLAGGPPTDPRDAAVGAPTSGASRRRAGPRRAEREARARRAVSRRKTAGHQDGGVGGGRRRVS